MIGFLSVVTKSTSMRDAFRNATIRCPGHSGISDLIAVPSLINLDFADYVRTIMEARGARTHGHRHWQGRGSHVAAAKQAIPAPCSKPPPRRARGASSTSPAAPNTSIIDINEAATIITEEADPEANIIFGAGIDENMKDEVRITVIATGFEAPAPRRSPRPRRPSPRPCREEAPKPGAFPLLSDDEPRCRRSFERRLARPAVRRNPTPASAPRSRVRGLSGRGASGPPARGNHADVPSFLKRKD
jgi:cell division protein FtsZ